MKLLLLWTLVASGWASQYAPGKMNEPIYNRTHGLAYPYIRQDHDRFDGYVATRKPDLIDSVLRICPWDSTLQCKDLLVVDCAGLADGAYDWMLENNIVVEIDHQTAVAWNTVGRGIRVDVFIQREPVVRRYQMK